jgi:hypothetical protein
MNDEAKKGLVLQNVKNLLKMSNNELRSDTVGYLSIKKFKQFYPYNLDKIGVMLFHCLRNKKVMEELLCRIDDDNYLGIGSELGRKISYHEDVNKFNHTDVSLAQTVFIVQQIIRKGIKETADFYQNRP